MATLHKTQYSLRNDKAQVFHIQAEVTRSYAAGDQGAEITALIERPRGEPFRYIVEFGGEFTKSKKNFTPEMYLHTAISIVCSQLESQRYYDTKLSVHRDSGLTETEPLNR